MGGCFLSFAGEEAQGLGSIGRIEDTQVYSIKRLDLAGC